MSAAVEQAPRGAVLAQVLSLLQRHPEGLKLGDVATAVGKPAGLMSVLLRQYVVQRHLVTQGQRPNTRYLLASMPLPAAATPVPAAAPAPEPKGEGKGVSRDAVIGALQGLLQALGLVPEDLLQVPLAPALPAPDAAPRQLVTPPVPAKKAAALRTPVPAPAPLPRPTSLPRTPGPKPVERRSFVPLMPTPAKRPAHDVQVVVPDHVQVKVCPSGTDRRFAAAPDAPGAGFMAEWAKLRGDCA